MSATLSNAPPLVTSIGEASRPQPARPGDAIPGITALVLAGSRGGQSDPMAREAGLAHKAMLPVAGVPMLSRVLRALRSCPEIGCIVVCAQQADAMVALLQDTPGNPRILLREAASSPSRSVEAMLAEFGAPLLVTTADHALLTPAMLQHLLANAPPGADVVAGIARASVVRAAFPDSRRTWLRFRDGAFSGCNLFLLAGPRAAGVVRFWRDLENDRKRPLAMARLVGLPVMLGYALRLITLGGTLRRLGHRTGAALDVVEMPFAEAAIDVDKPADLALANTILSRRLAA